MPPADSRIAAALLAAQEARRRRVVATDRAERAAGRDFAARCAAFRRLLEQPQQPREVRTVRVRPDYL